MCAIAYASRSLKGHEKNYNLYLAKMNATAWVNNTLTFTWEEENDVRHKKRETYKNWKRFDHLFKDAV